VEDVALYAIFKFNVTRGIRLDPTQQALDKLGAMHRVFIDFIGQLHLLNLKILIYIKNLKITKNKPRQLDRV
jgi:hypothetical protein